MSELINKRSGHKDFRWRLLTTVSALALIGNVYGAPDAKADSDTDRPTLWIELGGQLEQQTGQGDPYTPSFVANNPDSPVYKPGSPIRYEKPPLFSNGAEAKLTFEPSDTDWVFSAAVRYGRSAGHKKFFRTHDVTHVAQTSHFTYVGRTPTSSRAIFTPVYRTITQHGTEFAGAQVAQKQSHAIIDFTAGKDFGLGMFGKGGVSDFNIGVRFAQFVSKASGAIQAHPDAKFFAHCRNPETFAYYSPTRHSQFPNYKGCGVGGAHHLYAGTFQNQRSFHGIGPALSWNASLPILGKPETGALNVDWGANAALLFGRQRAGGSHQTSGYYRPNTAPSIVPTHHTSAGNFKRSKAVVVPNIGGFAGLSFNFTTVKVSAGYRADFFFGAMDTGIDARKTQGVDFYGPFATIGIGIGG